MDINNLELDVNKQHMFNVKVLYLPIEMETRKGYLPFVTLVWIHI